MHIKTTCPKCDSSFQVDAGLKGKRMRCPNPICRAVFEVSDGAAPPAPPVVVASPAPAPRPIRIGTVGNVVPILSAEIATAPAPSFEAAQPVASPISKQQAALDDFFSGVSPVAINSQEAPTFGDPVFGSMEGSPPVRQRVAEPQTNGASAAPIFGYLDSPPVVAKQRSRLVPLLLALLMLAAAGGLIWHLNAPGPSDEPERLARAEKAYKDHNFADAAALFGSLVKDFPNSEQRPVYQFLAELSDIREPIHKTQSEVKETLGHLDRLARLIDTYQSDPLLMKHRQDISESMYRLVEELTSFAAAAKDRPLLTAAKRLNDFATKKFVPAPAEQAKGIDTALAAAEQTLAKSETRQQVLASLDKAATAPSLDAIEQSKLLVQQAGLANDPEIKMLTDELPARHQKSIKFFPELAAESSAWKPGDSPPSFAVTFFRSPPRESKFEFKSRPALALVRGVLYAFDPADGTLRWSCRVGIDTTALPLWVPGTAATPPTVLVVSSEAGGLLALDGNDGVPLWRQALPQPCQSPPVIVGNHAFVACRSGAVFEIDVASGRRAGGYHLGQALTHGGVWQPGTDNIYFAGQRGCVFVLDVAQRQCAGILYTGHPRGAMHCPPVILPLSRGEVLDPSKAGPPPARLLLCVEAKGTSLASYGLPLTSPHASVMNVGDTLPGRIYFPPFCTAEHFSLVTDAGALAMFGLRQRENRDAEVFPLYRQTLPAASANGDRPMVVHADGQNFWVLAQDQLHHFQAGLSAKEGWKIGSKPFTLGSIGAPLHPGQVIGDERGHSLLFVVTESPNGRASWFTAVDLDKQTIRWQRQIGLVTQGSPVTIAGKVLVWDQGGDLLSFDAQPNAKLGGGLAGAEGLQVLRAQPGRAWLLPHNDGNSVIALSMQDKQAKAWKHQGGSTLPWGGSVALEAPSAGTPALVGDLLALPLANGRLTILSQGMVLTDDVWRSPGADMNALGHAVAVGPGKVICTDGSNGVVLWRFDGNALTRIKAIKSKSRITMAASLAVAGELRVCVTDVERRVTLFQGDDLRPVREWLMSEPITAGPFVRGGHIMVIVGGRRLVWLDPHSDKLPGYTFRADIVGEPQLIDGLMIVAEESGQIHALDLATRQIVGVGYTLKADVAAAATPMPFAGNRLFVPLTDGTVLLPSRDWFRPTFLGIAVRR